LLKAARWRATPAPPEKQFFAFFEFYPRRVSFLQLKRIVFLDGAVATGDIRKV
jgi:hypothetical protein